MVGRRDTLVGLALLAAPSVAGHGCGKGSMCGMSNRVMIPSQTTDLFRATPLIPVELPDYHTPILSPSLVQAHPQYSVESRRGKVVGQTEPIYFCKLPGYVLEGTSCIQTLIEEPRFLCPGGYEVQANRNCMHRTVHMQHCPEGFEKLAMGCEKTVSVPELERCPIDSSETPEGCCERPVEHPLTPTCPEGRYDPNTGTCCITVHSDATAFCPDGFHLQDGACLMEEHYDCTDEPDVLHMGTQYGILTPQHPFNRRLTVDTLAACKAPCSGSVHECTLLRSSEECSNPPPLPLPPQATQSSISVLKTCTRVTSTALVYACPQGVLEGCRCLVKTNIPPTPVCNALGDTTRCYTMRRVEKERECPENYSRRCTSGINPTCTCQRKERAVFATSCATGYDKTEEGCVRITQAMPHCAMDYVLQGDQCIKISRIAADCHFSVTYECDHEHFGECKHQRRLDGLHDGRQEF